MSSPFDTRRALKHFTVVDPILASLLKAGLTAKPGLGIAFPAPRPPDQYFHSIVRSIVSQQISTKAAASVFTRLCEKTSTTITPADIRALSEDELRSCGLSGQKTRYIRHNAEIWHTIDTTHFPALTDEAIITELTKLYGIGRWTAEMFLMFTLCRPDVFSFGDLGLMQSIYQHYPVKPHHTKKITALVSSWAPYRTIASLALWWHKDKGPVVL